MTAGDWRRRLRRIARIARWELSQTTTSYNRRTLVIALVIMAVVGGIGGAALSLGVASPAPNTDIYRIGVDADSPYAEVVESSNALAVREPSRAALETGEIDLLVEGVPRPTAPPGELRPVPTLLVDRAPSDKGNAALTAFRSAIQRYNGQLMAREPNASAAYPVIVQLRYQPQSTLGTAGLGGTQGDNDTTGGPSDDGTGDQNTASDDSGPTDDTGNGTSGADDTSAAGNDTAGGAGGDTGPSGRSVQAVDDTGGSPLGIDLFGGGGTTGSPAEISPPFPFSSLLLAFIFLIPMNFIIQAYGSSILNERISRRGELLLVAPVERLDIVAGKTLPYVAVAVAVTAAIAFGIGGSLFSVFAVIPIALTFLGATFVGAMFARSFKELTFVTVTITVFLTSYIFIPSIFTNVTPIALISPLTLVVMELQGEAVGIGSYVFSTAPFYLSSGVLFLLGTGVYREEDMFSQKRVPLKFLDALDARLSGLRSVGVLTALFVPFVFVFELLGVAVLFILPISISIPAILVVVAVVEEIAKSIHIYAGFENDRFDRSAATALRLGAASGVGFFVAEKFTIVAQAVGLPGLKLGRAALQPAGVTPSTGLLLLLGPLVLHTVTAGISALGARRNLRGYVVALLGAIVIHFAYNFGVVQFYG
ncbi:MAG: PrsW family intramembrane metalloprotease [Halonotius sp.]